MTSTDTYGPTAYPECVWAYCPRCRVQSGHCRSRRGRPTTYVHNGREVRRIEKAR